MCREQLQAVDQPRARAARSRRPRRPRRSARAPSAASSSRVVDRLLAARARRRSRTASPRRPRARPRRRCSQLTPRDGSPGSPSTSSPPASSISCGVQWPATYTGSSHSSAATRGRGCAAHGEPDAVDAPGAVARPARRPRVAAIGRLRRACARRRASRRASSGRARSRAGATAARLAISRDLVVGDGADRAQRLRDDQVGLELARARRGRARRSPRPASVRSRTAASISPALRPAGSDVARDAPERSAPRAGSRTRASRRRPRRRGRARTAARWRAGRG